MLEAAILCRYELALRPETLRWNDWIEGQKRKVFGGLGMLETDAWSSEFDIGQIGVDCVLGYLDYRFSEWQWRYAHPRLTSWYKRTSSRPSVAETMSS